MLSDRIIEALDAMNGVTISDVARAGGCTPSNLNRIKNGVRTPQPSSPTIRFLANGFIEIARQRNLFGELCFLCGANLSDSDDEVRAKLVGWLFEDEPPYVRSYHRRQDKKPGDGKRSGHPSTEFSNRFDGLMKIAGLSNRRLGIEAGLDPSYISRLRRGERIPKYRSHYIIRLCESILESITKQEKLSELYDLTELSEDEIADNDGAEGLRRWLFGYGSVTGYLAAEELMGTIASINDHIAAATDAASVEYDPDKILEGYEKNDSGIECGDESRYVGVDGIRSAVTRFLAEMIRNGEHDLLLYSDQSMDWMGGDYGLALKLLMAELIRRKVRIRIIHTVNRSMSELISAVEWWMPLYLTGMITSYYCSKSTGNVFSHTLFIRPGAACIAGTSAIGLESRAVYTYSADTEIARLAEDAFNNILNESQPLVHIRECDGLNDICSDNGFVRTDDLMVKAGPNEVKIQRIEPPYLMFTFTHPMICKAFRLVSTSGPLRSSVL